MKSATRATVALVATLLIGGAIGAFTVGAIAQLRRQPPPSPTAGGGFIGDMERLIEPRDEAQRAALRPYLEATDAINREAISQAESAMRDALEGMIRDVSPLLEANQLERLERALADGPRLAPGPRRGPPGASGGRPQGGPPRPR